MLNSIIWTENYLSLYKSSMASSEVVRKQIQDEEASANGATHRMRFATVHDQVGEFSAGVLQAETAPDSGRHRAAMAWGEIPHPCPKDRETPGQSWAGE